MLSIITPVYNGKRFIESCIKNVIAQHCPDAEHVIIDGGSSDGTVEIIKRYADSYSHICWVSEKDSGQSDAMNKGIAMARGQILGFLNTDDFYEQDILNWVVKRFADLPEPSLLVGNCNLWGDNGQLQGVNKPAHLKLTQLLVADETRYPFPINPSAYFYHKSLHDVIGTFDVNEHYTMDIDFLLKAVKNAHSAYFDKLLGNFRLVEGTKTFKEIQNGSADARFNALIRKFRNQLQCREKVHVWSLFVAAKSTKYAGIITQRFRNRLRMLTGTQRAA